MPAESLQAYGSLFASSIAVSRSPAPNSTLSPSSSSISGCIFLSSYSIPTLSQAFFVHSAYTSDGLSLLAQRNPTSFGLLAEDEEEMEEAISVLKGAATSLALTTLQKEDEEVVDGGVLEDMAR